MLYSYPSPRIRAGRRDLPQNACPTPGRLQPSTKVLTLLMALVRRIEFVENHHLVLTLYSGLNRMAPYYKQMLRLAVNPRIRTSEVDERYRLSNSVGYGRLIEAWNGHPSQHKSRSLRVKFITDLRPPWTDLFGVVLGSRVRNGTLDVKCCALLGR